ncbi:MAG TPA: glutamine--tRNA ligase/YqeY domain fusion protein, partial [Rubricoccaceae bacterium]|nr:glutamine--tRNA ligase/YqeY domain fusion protein [Rubricoccaceae bacterium]
TSTPVNPQDPEGKPTTEPRPSHFLREIVARDVAAGTYGGRVATRFPPEPNGYPHIGHAQSICLNFGLAQEFGGTCNLRYDDTNPETEDPEYVAALEEAVRWLGFSPAEIRFASDYFEQLYAWAVLLVEKGLAYVDSQTEEEIRANRGTVTEPGVESPHRDRPVDENLRLLDEMRRGVHPDGAHVLRAKIDMAHPNMKMRDPLMYRIRRDAHHYRRGDDWSIYPLYDWAHGQSDAIEGITHSVCTLEFDVNRPLYDWYLDAIGIPEPRNHQYEFARFNLDYTVMSKRKLRRLVEEGHVAGWDDPRMPTLAAQRRRGVRPEAFRRFFDEIGVTKVNGSTDLARYEHALRDDLNAVAPRVMAVTRPLRLVIENLSAGETMWLDAPYWPHDVSPPVGAPLTRRLPLAREVWIEHDDFHENPPKGWHRLAPGAEVRLRHAFVVKCTGVEKDDMGEVVALRAEADLATLGAEPEGRKVRGVIHWVSGEHARPARFRLYDRLFTHPAPDELEDFLDALNPESLVETEGFVEPSVGDDPPEARYQFERLGYFWSDPKDSRPGALVFNRIVALRDSWAKQAKEAPEAPPARTPRPEPRLAAERDPAAALSVEQRATYDALVARGVGVEEAAVLAADDALVSLFETVVAAFGAAREAGALLVHDLRPALGARTLDESKATPEALTEVLRLVEAGTLTRAGAREAVAALVDEGGDAAAVVEQRGLAAVRDDAALVPVVDAVLAEHADAAARYRTGETKLLGFFTGQAMRRAGKGADAARVQALLRERLGAERSEV